MAADWNKIIEIGKDHLAELARRYTDSELHDYRLIDCSRDDGRDVRLIYVMELVNGEKIVIKAARSGFATPDRVEAWGNLTYQYKDAGVYCPLFIRSRKNGHFCEYFNADGSAFVVWAEEYKAYKTLEEVEDELKIGGRTDDEARRTIRTRLRDDEWTRQIGDYLGRVCSVALIGIKPSFSTAYVMYDTFSPEDDCDENLENATNIYNALHGSENVDGALLEDIWQIYLAKRNELEPLYRRLPKGMVQGDLSWNNILVDDDLNFAGVIDFNLSGTETIIRYVINEGFDHPSGELGARWIDPGYTKECDRSLGVFLDAFRDHYTLSDDETQALGLIYNVVRPFTWPMASDLLYFFRSSNYEEVKYKLTWMYYELTRTDIADVLLAIPHLSQ